MMMGQDGKSQKQHMRVKKPIRKRLFTRQIEPTYAVSCMINKKSSTRCLWPIPTGIWLKCDAYNDRSRLDNDN